MLLLGGWRLLQGLVGPLHIPVNQETSALLGSSASFSTLVFVLLAWIACFALWELHIIGGGDAKTLMGILALFPTSRFLLFLSVAVLILSTPLLILKILRRPQEHVFEELQQRLRSGSLFPTQQDLEDEGRPYAWTFCLPAVVYLWFLW